MRDQLEALEELAKIDLGFRQLDVEQSEIDGHVADLRNDVARMRELLEREKTQLASAETLRSQTAQEILDLGERLARSTQRSNVAKNNREKEATQRELEVLRREREERTAKTTELETVVKQVRESITKHEEDFGKLQEVLAQDESELKTKSDDIAARRRSQEEMRKGATSKVRADLLRKYTTIRDRKGTAVAEVRRDGICRGCNISLAPQLVAKLHAGTDLHQCPNCNRILLFRTNTQGV